MVQWEKKHEAVAEVARRHMVVRIKRPEEAARRYAQNSLRAYLEGKKNLNWVVGVIRESGVRGARLADIFERFRDYGDPVRYLQAKKACEDQGWI